MIKLIAIDLDGTLYNSNHQLTQPGREAVWRAKDAGLQPVIVTGRGRRGAENALNLLEMDLPYICSAGALLRSGLDGETIHAWTFHKHDELIPLIDFTRQNGTGLIAESPDGTAYWFGPDAMSTVFDPLTLKESVRSFNPEKDFDRSLLKFTVAAETKLLAKAEEVIQAECPSLHYVYSGVQYIDLTVDGANKGSALHELAVWLNLKPAEIAAIGDQSIDMQMLEYAGLPIAMSNAVPSLKAVAKWIAPSNDENGVGWAIDEIIKQNMFESSL